MEAKSHPAEDQQAHVSPARQQQQSQVQGKTPAGKDAHDKEAVEAPSKKAGVVPERGPTTAAVKTSADERKVGRGQDHLGTQQLDGDAGGVVCADGGGGGHAVRHVVDLEPTTMSDLPSYVLLVGLGVCAVVLQVVLKRVGGRSLKP
jgi:hypothetical protein